MKTASKVFIIIGLIASVVLVILGFVCLGAGLEAGIGPAAGIYLGFGIYSLITSIGSLVSIHRSSKGAVIAWAVLYIPVMLLASIFMFCIKKEDLL